MHLNEVPSPLVDWMIEENNRMVEESRYFQAQRTAWTKTASGDHFATMFASRKFLELPVEQQNYIRLIQPESSYLPVEAQIPIYQGYLERALVLSKTGFRSIAKYSIDNIAVIASPTNYRYAATYRPHAQPNWHVVVLDWSFLILLQNFAFALASSMKTSASEEALEFKLDPYFSIKNFILDHGEQDHLRHALIASALPNALEPRPRVQEYDEYSFAHGAYFFSMLVHCAVAHEVAHTALGHHQNYRSMSREDRHKVEREADVFSLMHFFQSPWQAYLDVDPYKPLFACAMYSAFLAIFDAVDSCERLAHNFQKTDFVDDFSHPSGGDRIQACAYAVENLLNFPQPEVKVELLKNLDRMHNAVEDMWNLLLRQLAKDLEGIDPTSFESDYQQARADLVFL
ncbi:MAG: hypothetical protein AAGK23_09255 [Pseudomonadota bacterium]